MNTQETIFQLESLRLKGMAECYKAMKQLPMNELPTLDQVVAQLAEAEVLYRDRRRTELYLKTSRLRYDAVKADLLTIRHVEEVVYQESLVDALNANLRRISLVLGVVIALLLVISFALINNTVRLNICARRFTIHTMSLVGAKRSFISRPFVRQAVVQGAVSGLFACRFMIEMVRKARLKWFALYCVLAGTASIVSTLV